MHKRVKFGMGILAGIFLLGAGAVLGGLFVQGKSPEVPSSSAVSVATSTPVTIAMQSKSIASPAVVTVHPVASIALNLFFAIPGVLQESAKYDDVINSQWWLDSGAYLYVSSSGVASTIVGSLPTENPWRVLYGKDNPSDTDNGYHPQNIFRLVTRSQWQNYEEQAYFLIKNNNFSASSNRNESNGLLLFNRYQSGDSLYYAGLRVDGTAVVKKKINGIYYTMAQKAVFPGVYDHDTNPNLLPLGKWIGLKTKTENNSDGTVTITLYTDIGRTGTWNKTLTATDDGVQYGGAPIVDQGAVGIRIDFMDVEFDQFRVGSI